MKDLLKSMPETYEPKKTNRWVVDFPEDFKIESWVVRNITPLRYDSVVRKWDDLIITLFDPIVKSTSKSLMDLIGRGDYHHFKLGLRMLDPTGSDVEVYEMKGCKIKTFDFGETDYEIGEPKMITLTIPFKSCSIND